MPWPPPLPPTNRTDTTAQAASHASDHNQLATAAAAIAGTTYPGGAGWTEITYNAAWKRSTVAQGLGLRVALRGDIVRLVGWTSMVAAATNPNTQLVIGVVPAGFRPYDPVFCTANIQGADPDAFVSVPVWGDVRCLLFTDGTITCVYSTAPATPAAGKYARLFVTADYPVVVP